MQSGLITPLDPGSVAELRAYLRLDVADEDGLLERLIASSISLCETFTGQRLLLQRINEVIRLGGSWRLLSAVPVRAIESVARLIADGATEAVSSSLWEVDIAEDGSARIKAPLPDEPRARITYLAGLADTWADLPEPLRHGIVRLSAHLYTYRDAADDKGPPAVVAALWRPWRRYRLG